MLLPFVPVGASASQKVESIVEYYLEILKQWSVKWTMAPIILRN